MRLLLFLALIGCRASIFDRSCDTPLPVLSSTVSLEHLAEPIPLVLQTPPDYLSGDGPQCALGSLRGPNGGTHPILLKKSGHVSKLLCRYPKLTFAWQDPSGPRRAFLLSHCNDQEDVGDALPSEEQLQGQRLVLQWLEQLGLPAPNFRALSLTWRSGATATTRPALVVEDVAWMAQRFNATRADADGFPLNGTLKSFSDLDPVLTAQVHLFEILVDNRDWWAFELGPLDTRFQGPDARDTVLHNVFLVAQKDGSTFPVPYDLELSTLVGIPAGVMFLIGGAERLRAEELATPALLPGRPWIDRWMYLGVQRFRRAHPSHAVEAAVVHFSKHLPALKKLAQDPGWPEALRLRALEHVEAFRLAIGPRLDAPWLIAGAPIYDTPEGPARCTLAEPVSVRVVRRTQKRVQLTLLERLPRNAPLGRCAAQEPLSVWADADQLSCPGCAGY